ncbi:MAG: TonB family protein [Azovibrio sp.]|uniref:energy transducer TonB n=1 Tax=Azovibrio sp. TaxID=1872673 RepID=UPI003C729EF8
MKSAHSPLLLALALSLALHALGLLGLPGLPTAGTPPPRPALTASLRPPPAPEPASLPLPDLKLDEPPSAAKESPQAPPRHSEPVLRQTLGQAPRQALKAPPASRNKAPESQDPLTREALRQMAALAAQEDFYPREAIRQGIEGEVWVQIFLDGNGHVIAARIDRSSGHPSLDQAALRAARTLRSLPGNGLEEAVLPVRFRLE